MCSFHRLRLMLNGDLTLSISDVGSTHNRMRARCGSHVAHENADGEGGYERGKTARLRCLNVDHRISASGPPRTYTKSHWLLLFFNLLSECEAAIEACLRNVTYSVWVRSLEYLDTSGAVTISDLEPHCPMLRIKHINEDSCFLLTFLPSYAPPTASGTFPGAYTVLLDPWLAGPSKVFHESFALTEHTVPACIDDLRELPTPDLVLVSQEKDDHCNRGTLTQLPADVDALILGTSAAVKKIKSWKHFNGDQVQAIARYEEHNEDTIIRIPLAPPSDNGLSGEVTIALLAPKADLVGLHNAIAITYRAPSSVLSTYRTTNNMSVSAPGSRTNTPTFAKTSSRSNLRSPTPSAFSLKSFSSLNTASERTMSLIYSPHGIDYSLVKPYASAHLFSSAALPLTALIHCLDEVANPWYLGGTICSGSSSGIEIVKALCAKVWIGAHDEEKINTGMSLKKLKLTKHERDVIREKIRGGAEAGGRGRLESILETARMATELVELASGEEYSLKGG